MELFTNITLISTSAFLIQAAFFLTTKNFISALFFKFIPFALGVSCLIVFLHGIGVVMVSH